MSSEIGVDGVLVVAIDKDMLATNNGCTHSMVGDDLGWSIANLTGRRSGRDGILIEIIGGRDPDPGARRDGPVGCVAEISR